MTLKRLFTIDHIYYILVFALMFPLILLRDYTPANELRYLNIVDDALKTGNFFSFYNHGEIYADKPPLYFWIIMLGKKIFGSHQIWFLSLFSLLPAFVIQFTMDRWTRAELPNEYQSSAKLLLFTSALFMGGAIILRMDMLMSMFITLALYVFYRMYSGRERKYDKYLLPLCIFLAIFSKGPIGIIIPVVSILTFLTIKGKIKDSGKYLGFRTWGILLLLCSVWFSLVWVEAGNSYLNDLLFNQTFNRAVSSFHHKEPFYYYFQVFWYSFAPWSILFFALILLGIKNKLIKTDIDKLFLTVVLTSFLVLSIVSAKIEIYMLPVFPFVAYLSVIILMRLKNKKWIVYFMIALSLIAIMALPLFLLSKNDITFSWLNEIHTSIIWGLISLALFGFLSLYFLIFRKNIIRSINSISIGILTVIFIVSFEMPFLNSYVGYENMCKSGIELSENSKQYIVYGIRRPENMKVYLGESVIIAEKDDIMSDIYGGSILFISDRALRKDFSLREYIEKKPSTKIGDNLVVKL
ncbi:hypothetical protein D0T51_11655 [Parabacteroides sp. 52]|jgi:dolichyl-phosphate-mannose-protein mannosyltransferase|uniref:Undecaprenyl phosphate-alpha-4-amino-4-deoxy-L-arabinose arabinosyl transferase n=1 Tax=bioreactor metagenome TaxID=1076179 RepID=A0A644W2W9_9ZZZZ|nr:MULTISPECIES: glycosyltransferase family 39 protein [Bacteroidales]MDL2262308.1 glycosyltransferase family 39 protein [Bacteroidales bacterium OttesenSCG-928-I21]MDU1892965.1 glycosyltransferase family 39 protein [Dysgonomonas sp.]OJV78786.1 MAG: hypothetical protein BGO34_02325 [Bacteroidia bacterium 44-10]MCL3850974.1 glycosyltransferase family 39 protein [Parabacteroides leei]MDC2614794.1 glycosyltransferase family 39 protein [Bacteroides ovatus]